MSGHSSPRHPRAAGGTVKPGGRKAPASATAASRSRRAEATGDAAPPEPAGNGSDAAGPGPTAAAREAATPTRASGKRERILDAAIKVFAEKGFFSAKVSEIAREAGVADGTIYLYFRSKDDLLISLFEDRMERINAALRVRLAQEPTAIAKLRRFIEMHLELVEHQRALVEVLTVELRQSAKFMREYKNPKFGEFLKVLAGIVEEGQRSGELRTDISPPLVARAVFGALDELTLARALGRSEAIAGSVIAELLIFGIASPHTREPEISV
jgi:TetR/AcrR family fatty acid metabolism transcriptional regulator